MAEQEPQWPGAASADYMSSNAGDTEAPTEVQSAVDQCWYEDERISGVAAVGPRSGSPAADGTFAAAAAAGPRPGSPADGAISVFIPAEDTEALAEVQSQCWYGNARISGLAAVGPRSGSPTADGIAAAAAAGPRSGSPAVGATSATSVIGFQLSGDENGSGHDTLGIDGIDVKALARKVTAMENALDIAQARIAVLEDLLVRRTGTGRSSPASEEELPAPSQRTPRRSRRKPRVARGAAEASSAQAAAQLHRGGSPTADFLDTEDEWPKQDSTLPWPQAPFPVPCGQHFAPQQFWSGGPQHGYPVVGMVPMPVTWMVPTGPGGGNLGFQFAPSACGSMPHCQPNTQFHYPRDSPRPRRPHSAPPAYADTVYFDAADGPGRPYRGPIFR